MSDNMTPCPHCGKFTLYRRHCETPGCGWIVARCCLSIIVVATNHHRCPPRRHRMRC